MNYSKKIIKDGITLHLLKTKFKTDYSVFFLTLPLKKDTITENAILPAVLRSGTKKYENFQKITEELEMLYGASFDCGIDKSGDNIVLKFFIESINDEFLPKSNNNLIKSIDILLNIIFEPLVENNSFNKKYVETEKNNLEMIINSIKDNKDVFSYERCIELMYHGNGYGISKYGNIKDIKNINSQNLYKYYENLIRTAKIDIFISSNFENKEIEKYIINNKYFKNLNPRKEPIIINNFKKEIKEILKQENIIRENYDVTQGKLQIGLDILPNDFEDFRFIAILYNAILGNGVNSKLFQIVREKEGLAYTTKSEYIVQKNNIIISCGIECKKFEKTLNLIKRLIDDMKCGDFSEEDLNKAKGYIISGIDSIDEEQDLQILYIFGQELSKLEMSIDEYKERIKKVSIQEIKEFARYIQVNTVYFLENGGENDKNN